MNNNLGNRVTIHFEDSTTQILRNVTEIHYHYPRLWGTGEKLPSIAFESDIHGTGITHELSYIKEFKTELETERAENF